MASKTGGTTTTTTSSLTSGGGGTRTLSGTSAVDTLTYSTIKSTDATITHDANGWQVAYTGQAGSYVTSKSGVTTITGKDTLTNIERIAFSDKTIALDVLDTKSAAGAALAVYTAAFNTTPDAATLGRWIYTADHVTTPSSKSGGSTSSASLATSVAQSALSYYAPQGVGNDALVGLLYKNLVGRDADAGTVRAFSSQIENGTYSQAGLIALAAEQPQTQADYIGLVGQGVAYTPYSGSKAG